MELRNQWVQFKIRDVYHPDPTQVLIKLHGNDLLTGKVIDLSDSGLQKEAFVIVEVEGIEAPLVVPVERVLRPS
jgi:predicted ribosome quality control (RQC) complex YloA/Tae2 family protein